jgi:IS1 family transposase
MNTLKLEEKAAVINALVEGSSVRSTERMTGVHRDTILRLMVRVGTGCAKLMDEQMRGLRIGVVQLGDFWTYVAIDADTKMVPCYRVGKRDKDNTEAFVADLASRIENRVQISSDSLVYYTKAVEAAFGDDVDYGQIVKAYEGTPTGPGRYSPPRVVSARKDEIFGAPHREDISTSYVERSNLTMRMSIRRLTRLTNAFSKKLENLKAAVALHFAHYNYVRYHRSLRASPAMAAGVSKTLWSIADLVSVTDAGA